MELRALDYNSSPDLINIYSIGSSTSDMDKAFSVEEISAEFWSPPPAPQEPPCSQLLMKSDLSAKMNRSASEWAFQCFLQEAAAPMNNGVVEMVDGHHQQQCSVQNEISIDDSKTTSSLNVPPPDSEEYQAFLKSKLNLACAAVALTRASLVNGQDSTARADNLSLASTTSPLGGTLAPKGGGHDFFRSQDTDCNPSLPASQITLPGVPLRSTTSGSSREQSEEDEDEETATTENMNPTDAKRVRRESARRSRRRKQAHLTELETQVAQLRAENSSLLKRFTDISHKYNEAAVDNRVLKADVETLRAKVKMAEDTVKRLTGSNPLLRKMADISSFNGILPSDTSVDAAPPVQDDPNHNLYYQALNNSASTSGLVVNNGLRDTSPVENVEANSATAAAVAGNKMTRTASLQRLASLEHLQKRIRPHSNGEVH